MKTIAQLEEPLPVLLSQEFTRYAGQRPAGRREAWIAAGTVALWGRVIEGTRGYRAKCAYPQSLWLLPPAVFADALRLHFSGLRYGERRYERSIADAYLLPVLGDVPLRRLGRAHLAGYRAAPPHNPCSARPYSQRTVRRHLAVLRAAVSGAAERGWFTAAA